MVVELRGIPEESSDKKIVLQKGERGPLFGRLPEVTWAEDRELAVGFGKMQK